MTVARLVGFGPISSESMAGQRSVNADPMISLTHSGVKRVQ